MGTRYIAIDAGNTKTDVGLIDTTSLTCTTRLCVNTATAARDLPGVLKKLLAAALGEVPLVAACSVVPTLDHTLSVACTSVGLGRPVFVRWRENMPLLIDYEQPQRLGADRIADAFFARWLWPGCSSVVIDAGTTITVDLIRDGTTFAGGAIVPGIAMQLQALHAGTAALPALDPAALQTQIPGRSTVASISAGVRFAAAGAVNQLIRTYTKICEKELPVIATGGAFFQVAPLMEFRYDLHPDATLIGAALFDISPRADAVHTSQC